MVGVFYRTKSGPHFFLPWQSSAQRQNQRHSRPHHHVRQQREKRVFPILWTDLLPVWRIPYPDSFGRKQGERRHERERRVRPPRPKPRRSIPPLFLNSHTFQESVQSTMSVLHKRFFGSFVFSSYLFPLSGSNLPAGSLQIIAQIVKMAKQTTHSR